MSLHASNTEAQAVIEKQRRMAFLTSAAISFLVVILLLLLLSLFLLPAFIRETPAVIVYQTDEEPEEPREKKIENKVNEKPAAPASAMSKVIASNMQANVAVPVTDMNVTIPSLEFGAEFDFSQGWGTSGDGVGEASFFKQKVSAKRIAYVIDYSASMNGKRDQLMRAELTRSVSELPSGMDYQLIFFAGPAWVAGDSVKVAGNKGTVTTKGSKSYEWAGRGALHWEPVGNLQEADWLKVGKSQIKKSLDLITGTKLVYGTDWEHALDMALEMDPPPQFIFFMTDGDTGNMTKIIESISKKAKRNKTVINTVAMMQPKAEAAMAELAKNTGGTFTMIDASGEAHEIKGGGK